MKLQGHHEISKADPSTSPLQYVCAACGTVLTIPPRC